MSPILAALADDRSQSGSRVTARKEGQVQHGKHD